MTIGVAELRHRLASAPLDALDLDAADRALVVHGVATLDEEDAATVARIATILRRRIGTCERPPHPFGGVVPRPGEAPGLLPLLALVATASDVVGWLRERGLDAAAATSGVADLGQQMRVHRRATGVGGIDTAAWLARPWSASLLRHGALQVEHVLHERLGWVRSVHVPAGASIARADVDASIAASVAAGALAFPERATEVVLCDSWMLDPWLVEALPDSRLAAFAQRWDAIGDDRDGTDDALWFVWGRRPPLRDLAALPRDTRLRRAMAERLEAGERVAAREGVLRR